MENIEVVTVPDLPAARVELAVCPAQALVVNTPDAGVGLLPAPAEAFPQGSLLADMPVITCWLPGAQDAARRLGAVSCLTKPVQRQTLLDALAEAGAHLRNVLIVDDNAEELQLFSRVLASAPTHYTVYRAMNGRQAIELMRERSPDIMLLDLAMPDVDGFQVLKEKDQDPLIRDIPVIIVSSLDPAGTPIVSPSLAVARHNGLSAGDLLACLAALSEVLCPGPRRPRREPSADAPGSPASG